MSMNGSREQRDRRRRFGCWCSRLDRALGLAAVLLLLIPGVLRSGESDGANVLNEVQKLVASDGAPDDWFGESVAIDGEILVVGSDIPVIPASVGSAYVFERDAGGQWLEAAKLVASDGATNDQFGISVTVSGTVVLVGARFDDDLAEDSGTAFVYERDEAEVWSEVAKLVASDGAADDQFGGWVAVDGETAAVGAIGHDELGSASGSIYVFERDGAGVWAESAELLASDGESGDTFGVSVAIDGDTLVVGADGEDDLGANAGAAYVFERDELGLWSEVAKLTAPDGAGGDSFGGAVAVHGSRIVVGAPLSDPQGFNSGSAYVFESDPDGSWVPVAKLLPADVSLIDNFGESVDISGDRIVAGAFDDDDLGVAAGAAYIFERDASGIWSEVAKLLASDGAEFDQFGAAVAISGTTPVVGARYDDDLGDASGSAYVFELAEGPLLSVTGVCPGEITIGLTGATPDSGLGLIAAFAEGSSSVPAGPCAGTLLGLENPIPLTVVITDGSGSLSIPLTVGDGACGRFLQALDTATCAVSNVAAVP